MKVEGVARKGGGDEVGEHENGGGGHVGVMWRRKIGW